MSASFTVFFVFSFFGRKFKMFLKFSDLQIFATKIMDRREATDGNGDSDRSEANVKVSKHEFKIFIYFLHFTMLRFPGIPKCRTRTPTGTAPSSSTRWTGSGNGGSTSPSPLPSSAQGWSPQGRSWRSTSHKCKS